MTANAASPSSATRVPRRPVASSLRWLLATCLTAAAVAGASAFLPLDLDERLVAAREAAVGTVIDVDVVLRDGEPWTLVTLEVERWWRRDGAPVDPAAEDDTAPTLTAAFWGGRAPGAPALQVAGVPTFAVGERVLWLLRAADDGLGAPTVGVTQGVWRAVAGRWQGDDGSVLGVDGDGRLTLTGDALPDATLFEALDAAYRDLEEAP